MTTNCETVVIRTMDTTGREMDSFEIQTRRCKRRSGEIVFRLIGPTVKRTLVSKRKRCLSHIEVVVPAFDEMGLPVRPRLSTGVIGKWLSKGESVTFAVPRTVLVIS